ncbi:alpha/beta hydrolase family protein [Nesterenkonia xinjiangensis]|uniref:Alpha-beta hydrolase superfamily lysophospholipase n=1 Tax=Nesterenkonia xinjiangensis TaxID=225327 RepID=A0A7Z0KBT6_9MICC|nr:alpha/beta fold hydrolase [Nesterenkonia xinjiangensis]NYJ79625.1 alpha-beta hydrolase superfamily lysophospholipase [Nesterenkonia xinjiangensis]
MSSRAHAPGTAARALPAQVGGLTARIRRVIERLPERRSRRTPDPDPPTPWLRASMLGVGTGLAAGMTLAGAASALAGHFARVVVTPAKEHAEDLEILAVVRGPAGDEVILPATPETVVEGTYGLNFHGGRASARIGEISSFSPRDGTIARRVEKVHDGDLRQVNRGWWTSVPDPTPDAAGFISRDVVVELPGGPAPAWHVPPRTRTGPLAEKNVWGVMVHGRGGRRAEGIRALGVAERLGIDALLISYRNDGEAPDAPDGRYGLGITEWEDVEAAVQHALDQGAEDVLLFGWSMGGAIALQTADRSRLAPAIRGLVLTGPVVDWIDVLGYQARANRIPEAVGRLGSWFISHPAGRRVTGLAAPVDLKALNWIDRADQLHVRTLILHSSDDDVVPYVPSRNLAERNEMVTFVPFTQARHVKEWNHDRERWEQSVVAWVTELFGGDAPAHLSSATRRAR